MNERLADGRCRILAAILLAVACLAPRSARAQAGAPPEPAAQSRPRVGLALGGGSARGLAHIGVLKWLEEHRIPIDAVAGTSMGGLVGGAYATGLTPAELADLMRTTNWDVMLTAESPFQFKAFRRKEDARAFPAQIDFGLKGGFKLPSALNAGQQVQLLLDRLALAYYDLPRFDDLPTPFRSVAVDLRKGRTVVFDSGSLSLALRATMAIPGVLTPVEMGDRLLVDGGALNNVPADVVRGMNADVVIAVDVAADVEPQAAQDLFTVLGTTVDVMMAAATRRVLEQADVVIDPDLAGLYSLDFRKTDEFVERGYKAAEAMAARLAPYQVDEVAFAAWRQARETRRRRDLPIPAFVQVDGVSAREEAAIRSRIERRHLGRPLSRDALETDVLAIAGTDRYEVVSYHLSGQPRGVALALSIQPKVYGPPFLLAALDLRNTDSTNFAANIRARIAMYDSFVAGSDIRLDVGVGTQENVGLELYRRIRPTPLFVAPRVYFQRSSVNAYQNEVLAAEYREKRTGAGLDVGVSAGQKSELRLGFDIADVRVRRRVGESALPEAAGAEHVASLRWTFDGQDSPVVPSRGVYTQAAVRRYLEMPELETGKDHVRQDGPRDLTQAEARLNWFHTWHRRERAFVLVAGGTSFGDDPNINQFRLGGPLRLGGYNNDAIVGPNYVLLTAGVLHEWFRLPDLVGGGVYLGAWVEHGSAFRSWNAAKYYGNVSAGLITETLFGPLFLGGSVNVDGGSRFYVAFGSVLK